MLSEIVEMPWKLVKYIEVTLKTTLENSKNVHF